VKSLRFVTLTLAAVALALVLSGCGKSTSPTSSAAPAPDNSPPAAPANLSIHMNSGKNFLTWDASASANVQTYDVFAYVPDPTRDNAYIQIGETSAPTTSLQLPPAYQTGLQYFKVLASNGGGNNSSFSTTLQVVVAVPQSNTGDPTSGPGAGPGSGRGHE
jgi:hypothetical protein